MTSTLLSRVSVITLAFGLALTVGCGGRRNGTSPLLMVDMGRDGTVANPGDADPGFDAGEIFPDLGRDLGRDLGPILTDMGGEAFTLHANGSAGAIPDSSTVSFNASVSSSCIVSSLEVNLSIEHTYPTDLVIRLTSSSGTSVILCSGDCTGDGGIAGSFPSTLTPYESLGAFAGTQALGTWTLEVSDEVADDEGFVSTWSIDFLCN